MRKLSLLLLLFCLNTFHTSYAQDGLIYHTDFTSSKGWENKDDVDAIHTVSSGVLNFKRKAVSSVSHLTKNFDIDFSRNFSIETSVMHTSGIENNAFGISFGQKDIYNENRYGITKTGYFIVSQNKGNILKDHHPWATSPLIYSTKYNKLRIEKIGSVLSFFINGIKVSSSSDIEFFGNKIGFFIVDKQSASFDYLTIKYLDNKQTTVVNKVKEITNGNIIYQTDFNTQDYWGEGTGENDIYSYKVSNGKFTLSAKTDNFSSLIAKEIDVDLSRNFSIETSLQRYSGATENVMGLAFGYKDPENSFQFGISSTGYYTMYYSFNGKNTYPIPWTLSNAIKLGNDVANILKIEKVGDQLLFYINGIKVAEKPMMVFFGNHIGFVVSNLQSVGYDYLRVNYLDSKPEPEPIIISDVTVEDDKVGPQIVISRPSVVRGLKVVQNNISVDVAGKATDASGIYTVTINGIRTALDAEGNFLATVPLAVGDNQVTVLATDLKMNVSKFQFATSRPVDKLAKSDVNVLPEKIVKAKTEEVENNGKYYALIIGIQDYDDEAIPDLDQPVADAKTLYDILKSNYTFIPENLYFLKNPNRNQIFDALEKLSAKVTKDDNLLIFYAGHGNYDENKKQGYWYPSDAKLSSRASWLTNADLKEYLTSIPSKHTLLITDACFAGSIFKTRSVLTGATRDINELYNLPSRKAMTSGTLKEVPDKSVFIEYLVKRLTQNAGKYLSAEQLFSSFRTAVINNSANGQVPQFGEIKEAGDEGGDFIFIKK